MGGEEGEAFIPAESLGGAPRGVAPPPQPSGRCGAGGSSLSRLEEEENEDEGEEGRLVA